MLAEKNYSCEQCGRAIRHRGKCLPCNYAIKHGRSTFGTNFHKSKPSTRLRKLYREGYVDSVNNSPEKMSANELKTKISNLADEIKELVTATTSDNSKYNVSKIRRRARTIRYYSTFLMFDAKDIKRIEELKKA